jgi:hypothetical protein
VLMRRARAETQAGLAGQVYHPATWAHVPAHARRRGWPAGPPAAAGIAPSTAPAIVPWTAAQTTAVQLTHSGLLCFPLISDEQTLKG